MKQAIYQIPNSNSSLRQGEILTDLVQYNPDVGKLTQDTQEISFTSISHPYAIVITQDCDLDWDYKARNNANIHPSKLLNSIILCEVSLAKDVREIEEKSIMNRGEWDLVKSQRHERFYFFEKIPTECELQQIGIPELTADFKKVFGMDAATLYRQIDLGVVKRRAFLTSPYLEHFSRRYHSFQGRVALPYQYESQREG